MVDPTCVKKYFNVHSDLKALHSLSIFHLSLILIKLFNRLIMSLARHNKSYLAFYIKTDKLKLNLINYLTIYQRQELALANDITY